MIKFELYVVERIDSQTWISETPTVGDRVIGLITARIVDSKPQFELSQGKGVSEATLRKYIDREAGATGIVVEDSVGNFGSFEFTRVGGELVCENWR